MSIDPKPTSIAGVQYLTNVVRTGVNYTMEQNDAGVLATVAITVTLCPEPLALSPVLIYADGGDVTVAGPLQGGTVTVPQGTTATFSFSPVSNTWGVSSSPNGSGAQSVTTWYVDPSNSWPGGAWSPSSTQTGTPGTGSASNSNSGTSPSKPLLTFSEIVRRWGTNAPTLSQNTIIVFLSDQPGFNDPVEISPILNQCFLTIIGTPTILVQGGTIGSFTGRSYTTGTSDTFVDTSGKIAAAQPVLGFTAYNDLMIQTATATCWINADESTPTNVVVSAPMQTITSGSYAFLSPGDGSVDPSGNVPPPLWVTLANSQSFNIVRPCIVYVTQAFSSLASALGFQSSDGVGQSVTGIILQNLWSGVPPQTFPVPDVVAPDGVLPETYLETCYMQQCRFDSALYELGIFRTSKTNCDFTNLNSSNSRFYGGMTAIASPISYFFGQTFDGDCTIRFFIAELSPAQIVFGTCRLGEYCSPVGAGGNGGPGNVYYITANNDISVFYCPEVGGSVTSGQLWGPAVAVDITQGTSFQIANTTGVTAETSFPSSGTAITIDGSAGGSTATQLSTFHSGAWTHYVTAISPAGLDALASGHVPATAAIQNPDTGSKFVLNGGIQPIS